MKVLAIFSIKGGVGKTATAVNLADFAARSGRRVLLWDLDPQGAASFYLRIEPRVKGGITKVMEKGRLERWIRESDHEGVDLMPADFSYRNFDLALDAGGKPRRRLGRLLKPLAEEYDVVFLDCPPSISLASESVFRAADALVSPVIPTTLSLRTHRQLERHLAELEDRAPVLVPFFALADRRKTLHRELCASVPLASPGFLRTRIPYSSVVEQMGVRRAPIGAFAPGSAAGRAYRALWDEVATRVDV